MNEVVKSVLKLWQEYEKKVDEVTFIRDTLKEKFVNTVYKIYGYDNTCICIQDYLKDKTKENKRRIKTHLDIFYGKQKWDIDKIVCCGNDVYGYQIPFKIDKIKYYIQIPNHPNLSVENICYANYGMYQLCEYENDYCVTVIFADYDRVKIADKIEEISKGTIK